MMASRPTRRKELTRATYSALKTHDISRRGTGNVTGASYGFRRPIKGTGILAAPEGIYLLIVLGRLPDRDRNARKESLGITQLLIRDSKASSVGSDKADVDDRLEVGSWVWITPGMRLALVEILLCEWEPTQGDVRRDHM